MEKVRNFGTKNVSPKYLKDCISKKEILDLKEQAIGYDNEEEFEFQMMKSYFNEINENSRENEEEPQSFHCYSKLSNHLNLNQKFQENKNKKIYFLFLDDCYDVEFEENLIKYFNLFFSNKFLCKKKKILVQKNKNKISFKISKKEKKKTEIKIKNNSINVHDVLDYLSHYMEEVDEKKFFAIISISSQNLHENDDDIENSTILGRCRGDFQVKCFSFFLFFFF